MDISSPRDVIEKAIETFVRGFTFTRSFTHPYIGEQVEGLWVMRDSPRKSGKYRTEEWVAHGMPAQEIDATVRQNSRGKFVICAICAEDEAQAVLNEDFKSLNYRRLNSEPLMLHRLAEIPDFAAPSTIDIERVMSLEMADRLAKAAGSRQILPRSLIENARQRTYVARNHDQLVGWVSSIDTGIETGNTTWCCNMFVDAEFRRRGIARALMSRMLQEDRTYGAKQAVLLASHTGAKLYPIVGYAQIGTLLLYAPKIQFTSPS